MPASLRGVAWCWSHRYGSYHLVARPRSERLAFKPAPIIGGLQPFKLQQVLQFAACEPPLHDGCRYLRLRPSVGMLHDPAHLHAETLPLQFVPAPHETLHVQAGLRVDPVDIRNPFGLGCQPPEVGLEDVEA